MSNDISAKQNEQKELERLSAQRELYSSAKIIFLAQIILTVIIPVTLTIISIYHISISPYSALYGVCIFAINMIFMETAIKKKKNKAAKIQELFDCSVFSLPHSPLKVVDDVSVEEVLSNYNAHVKIKSNVEKIRNWYPPVVSEVSLSLGRIICQRAACWWDKKLRNNYRLILTTVTVLIPMIVLILAFLEQLQVPVFTMIISAMVPFIQMTVKHINDNNDADYRLEQLSSYINLVWEKIKSNSLDVKALELESRRIQDAIFDNRVQSPLVFDYFYNLFRKNDESIMTKAAKIYVKEAKSFKSLKV